MTGHARPPAGVELCHYCPCPARFWSGAAFCEHHYWHGTDLPCPDCAAVEDVA